MIAAANLQQSATLDLDGAPDPETEDEPAAETEDASDVNVEEEEIPLEEVGHCLCAESSSSSWRKEKA